MLPEGKVIAGASGLENEICSVDVLEVPDSAQYIAPGQLEISALYSILDSDSEQIRVIHMLKACKASGLVLSHVGVIMKSVSSKMIEICDQLSFPLIQVPHNIAYTDILSPLIDRLLNVQNQRLATAMQIYDQMTALILDECDFERILNTLSPLIHRNTLYFSHNDTCIASSRQQPEPAEIERITSVIQKEKASLFRSEEVLIHETSHPYLLVPVSSSSSYYGVMAVSEPDGLSPLERIAIMQTKNALGIMTLNKINLKDCNQLLLNDYINDLLISNFVSEESVIQRGYALGCDITTVATVLVIDIYNFSAISTEYSEAEIGKLKKQLRQLVSDELSYASPESIFLQRSDKIIMLYTSKEPSGSNLNALTRLGNYFISKIHASLGIDVTIGIGSICQGVYDTPTSYQAAQNAVDISNRLFKCPRCTSSTELPVYSLFVHETIDVQELKNASQRLLAPVIAEEQKCGIPLLETFRRLIMSNMNTSRVADDMFIHKNTVLQRKQKIMRLYPYPPFESPYMQQFVTAFTIIDLYP